MYFSGRPYKLPGLKKIWTDVIFNYLQHTVLLLLVFEYNTNTSWSYLNVFFSVGLSAIFLPVTRKRQDAEIIWNFTEFLYVRFEI